MRSTRRPARRDRRLLLTPAIALAQEDETDRCEPRKQGEQCGEGNGRTDARRRRHRQGLAQGLAEDHRHPVEGARQRRPRAHRHRGQRRAARPPRQRHSSIGGAGKDVLWGDWEPKDNGSNAVRRPARRRRQRLPLSQPRQEHHVRRRRATTGSSPTTATARSTAGRATSDYAQTRGRATPTRSATASIIRHFCAFGSKPNGDCKKPGESALAVLSRQATRALLTFLDAW